MRHLGDSGIAREVRWYYPIPMATISLKLPDLLLEVLEKESRARGTTKSALVRECLTKSLDGHRSGEASTCYDLAHDLAGSLKGLPRDLATNPKHMDGFGQ
jgi:hypothetical protein